MVEIGILAVCTAVAIYIRHPFVAIARAFVGVA